MSDLWLFSSYFLFNFIHFPLKGGETCLMDLLVKGEVSSRVDGKSSLRDNRGNCTVQFSSEDGTDM